MKKFIKISVFAFVLLLLSTGSFAQVAGEATAFGETSAWIIEPIAIELTTPMEFGDIAISASVDGTVILTAADPTVRTATAGATLPAINNHPETAAMFTVSGVDDYLYTITLPTTPYTITDPVSAESMTVTGFNDNLGGAGQIQPGGLQTFYVGATLNVAMGQEPGHYVNPDLGFVVTVIYN